ncbi:MAG: F0F1 ATP synthase assembly protein I [Gammaproteobacteria bacterium]|nr:MAG: F0F1 ATP synthase assembly protein I [Gammaproteobacteria bacterium]
MHDLDARRARRLLATQFVTLLAVAATAGILGLPYMRDAFIGGLAAFAGSAVFALWVFGRYRAQEPGRIVANFYGGEVIKILVVAAIFAAAILGLPDLHPLALLGAFLVVQVLPPLLANRIAG